MGDIVVAHQSDMAQLRDTLDDTYGRYTASLNKLDTIEKQIESDFKGTAAEEFKRDYIGLGPTFAHVSEEVQKAYDLMDEETTKFVGVVNDLSDGMSERVRM